MSDNNSLRDQFGSRDKSSGTEGDSGDFGGAFGSRSEGEEQQPAPAPARPAISDPGAAARSAAQPSKQAPAEDEGPNKRYYTPGEVMAKKGCIGCGGMVLAIPLLLGVVGLALRLR